MSNKFTIKVEKDSPGWTATGEFTDKFGNTYDFEIYATSLQRCLIGVADRINPIEFKRKDDKPYEPIICKEY